MTDDLNQNPPANTGNPEPSTGKADGVFVGAMDDGLIGPTVNIQTEHVHFQPNNIAELGALADRHPDLAAQLVANDDAKHKRVNRSYMLGVVVAAAVFITGIIAAAWALVSLGWWQALMFVAATLALSHVIRTTLTGEWSDTSWFAKILGVKTPKDP